MGAIFPPVNVECERCGVELHYEQPKDVPEHPECVVCKSLGDRALVPLMRTKPGPEREAALVAFRASPPGSVLFNAGLMRRGVPQYGMDVHTYNPKS